MKINQIIREKRKELSLTQEQVAELLGVSTPAVNKWEKGSTYPDITLLPALARLLKMDLNTLLSFNEDLTDVEIWRSRVSSSPWRICGPTTRGRLLSCSATPTEASCGYLIALFPCPSGRQKPARRAGASISMTLRVKSPPPTPR